MKKARRRFSDILRDARTKADLTQQDLADQLGVRQSTVSAWEMEVARPRNIHLVKLSAQLGLDLAEITVAASEPIDKVG